MHGANRLGGNSLSDLVVFGRRAGMGAAEYVEAGDVATSFNMDEAETAVREALEPFDRAEGENPYTIQHDLQEMMQALVGIIRTGPELEEAMGKLDEITERVKHIAVKGGRAYNPGWNLDDRPAGDAHRLSFDGARGEPAQGVARRSHPRGLPEPRPRVREVQLRALERGRQLGQPDHGGRVTAPADARRTEGSTRGGALMADVTMRIWRGDSTGGDFENYTIDPERG